jgi:hypothetical protein
MGAKKFGPPGWHTDPEWKGAWGPNPPFHTPVFVLTHHTRPSIEMEGGTTYHFIDASPAEALEAARKAAGGQDVRIGGGPITAVHRRGWDRHAQARQTITSRSQVMREP